MAQQKQTFNIQEYVEENPAEERFKKLDNDRNAILDRARNSAKLTIPSVVPDSGHSETQTLETPFQALGSRLVNGLSSKLMLSLFPPNLSFFRLVPSATVKEAIQNSDTPEVMEEIDKNYMLIEQEMLRNVERQALRVPIFEALKGLIIAGNSCLYKTDEGIKNYNLNNYVVVRDYFGNIMEIITKEGLNRNTLDDDLVEALNDEDREETETDAIIDLYTRCILRDGIWYEWQEVGSNYVEGSDTTYATKEELPFIPLRWTSINGENYGRGHVEQYLGDFRSLEALYQILIETSEVASKVIFGRKPGAITEVKDLQEAVNGDVIEGDLVNDITVLRVEKGGDLQVPLNLIQDLTRRLEQAFLSATSATRDSERTTATEIRYLANDLEESLGGLYSLLSLELQKPLAYKLLKDSDVVVDVKISDVIIVTGLDALGRNVELDKILQFTQIIQQIGSPELILPKMKVDGFIKMIGNAIALDVTTLIKSDEEVQAEQQAQQESELAMQGASLEQEQQIQQQQG